VNPLALRNERHAHRRGEGDRPRGRGQLAVRGTDLEQRDDIRPLVGAKQPPAGWIEFDVPWRLPPAWNSLHPSESSLSPIDAEHHDRIVPTIRHIEESPLPVDGDRCRGIRSGESGREADIVCFRFSVPCLVSQANTVTDEVSSLTTYTKRRRDHGDMPRPVPGIQRGELAAVGCQGPRASVETVDQELVDAQVRYDGQPVVGGDPHTMRMRPACRFGLTLDPWPA